MQARRAAFWAITVSLLCAMQGLALQSHPRPVLSIPQRQKPEPLPAPPQLPGVIDATAVGSPLALTKGWRVGITSDPAAANPNFDDSGWAIRDAGGTIADVPEPDEPERPGHDDKYAWFRIHLKLAPNHGPIALLVTLPVTQSTSMNLSNTGPGADVFANGKMVLPEGPHPDTTYEYQQISRLYHLNIPPSETR